jgi:hypothetical protein
MGGTHHGHPTMNDAARRLRAQKAYSTDPAYLERMAREEETRGVGPTKDAAAADGGNVFARCAAEVRSQRPRDNARTARSPDARP